MNKNKSLLSLLVLMIWGTLMMALTGCDTNSAATEPLVGLRSDNVPVAENPVTAPVNENTPVDAAPVGVDGVTVETSPGTIAVEEQVGTADRPEHAFDPDTATPLSVEDMEGLIYMREEEKLARDVYLALHAQWGLQVFQNIAGSEQAHMDSVLTVMDSYGVVDPAATLASGQFSNPDFTALYEQLVAQGSISLADALKVGATIEELDILDLEARLVQTENEYIIQVYNNLLSGSENHLRAYVSNLERQTGEIYQPAYLEMDAYQAIISATNGGGGNGRNNGGNGGGNGNGRGNGGGGNGQGGNGQGNGQGQGA